MRVGIGIYKKPLNTSKTVSVATTIVGVATLCPNDGERWFVNSIDITTGLTVDYVYFDDNVLGVIADTTISDYFGETLCLDDELRVTTLANGLGAATNLVISAIGWITAK